MEFILNILFCFNLNFNKGFGDIVPGQNFSDPNLTFKLTISSIYVVIGLAVLAMCLDLVQEVLFKIL